MAKWDQKQMLSSDKCFGYSEEGLQRVLSKLECYFSVAPGLCRSGECSIIVESGSEVVNIPPPHPPPGLYLFTSERL